MVRRRNIWKHLAHNVKARRHAVGLGASAGALLVAVVTPLAPAPAAGADTIDHVSTAGGPAHFDPGGGGQGGNGGNGGQGGRGGNGGSGGSGGAPGAGGAGGAGGAPGAGGAGGAPGAGGQPGQPGR